MIIDKYTTNPEQLKILQPELAAKGKYHHQAIRLLFEARNKV